MTNHLFRNLAALAAIYLLGLAVFWPAIAKSDEDAYPVEPIPVSFYALEDHHADEYQSQVSRPRHMSFTATVTGYGAEPGQTDDTPFITANGEHVHAGGIACPVRFSFGTRFRIGGNEYVCNDRMNPRYQKTDRFDIFFPANSDAIHFGTRTMSVEVL